MRTVNHTVQFAWWSFVEEEVDWCSVAEQSSLEGLCSTPEGWMALKESYKKLAVNK